MGVEKRGCFFLDQCRSALAAAPGRGERETRTGHTFGSVGNSGDLRRECIERKKNSKVFCIPVFHKTETVGLAMGTKQSNKEKGKGREGSKKELER